MRQLSFCLRSIAPVVALLFLLKSCQPQMHQIHFLHTIYTIPCVLAIYLLYFQTALYTNSIYHLLSTTHATYSLIQFPNKVPGCQGTMSSMLFQTILCFLISMPAVICCKVLIHALCQTGQ